MTTTPPDGPDEVDPVEESGRVVVVVDGHPYVVLGDDSRAELTERIRAALTGGETLELVVGDPEHPRLSGTLFLAGARLGAVVVLGPTAERRGNPTAD